MVRRFRLAPASAFAALALLVSTQVSAETYAFKAITSNQVADVDTGEAQLFVDVTDAGNNKVLFRFWNKGPNSSSITDVYFDDGTLIGLPENTHIVGTGVDFSEGASPSSLPGGNAVDFHAGEGFSADSNPPTQPNGVNPGEELKIIFGLQDNKTITDTIAALSLSLLNPGIDVDGGLRIGVHVQGFASGGSESFVNTVLVPLPEAAWGGMVLLAGIGWWRFQQSRKTLD